MLSIAEYEVFFTAESPLSLPAFPGILWHSVFGKALHDVACTHPNTDCNNCLRLHDCDYPAVFKPCLPPGSQIMTRYTQIPAPHLFQAAVDGDKTVSAASKKFSIKFSLVGKANTRLPSVLHAMQMIGQNGVGKSRVKARIEAICRHRQSGKPEYLEQSNTSFDVPDQIAVPALPGNVCVQFVSPYSPPGNRSPYPENFDLSVFLMSIVRRIDLLSYFYNGQKLDVDFKQLKSLSLKEGAHQAEFGFRTHKHYTAREKKSFNSVGIVGKLELDCEVSAVFWPFLFVGQFLNSGKKASYGMGQYRCVS